VVRADAAPHGARAEKIRDEGAATRFAGVGAQVEVPAREETGGGGKPGEDAPNAYVCVPVGGQVAAAKRHAGENRG